ncbi:MFS transporter [Lentzea pudingi]|uniref:MFS transporter n=2 Tax=Lentzea pudingi TaxID=1789439 RepID=A0ABQ2HBQ4_9PSEU|nr:MFS transporter [Lentzea pudingi]
MCSGLLLVAMDNTILNVALPAIADELRPGNTALLWIVDLYSLVVAGLLVTAGTASDRSGRKKFFLIGMALFGISSVVAAFSGSIEVLLASRVLRGIGGAMIMPATLSVIRNVFTDSRERGVAIGIWSATASAGSAIGPILAGAALQYFHWGSVFLISLPIVVVAMVLTVIYVPESRDPSPGRFDPLSVVLSMAAVVGVVYGVKELAGHGLAPVATAVLLAGLTLAFTFVRRQGKLDSPLLDLSLFKARRFVAATLSVLLSFFGFFGLLFFLTQYFQILRGYSPLETGLWLLPLALASVVAAPLTGAIVARTGTRVTLAGAFALLSISLGVFSLLGGENDTLLIVLGFLGVGFGASVAVTAGSQAIMTSAPPERAGGAAAIQETSFELGAGLGVALLGSVMAALYSTAMTRFTDTAASESLPAAAVAASKLDGPQAAALMDAAKAAFIDGLSAAALVGAGVMLITAVLAAVWLPPLAVEREELAAGAGGDW